MMVVLGKPLGFLHDLIAQVIYAEGAVFGNWWETMMLSE